MGRCKESEAKNNLIVIVNKVKMIAVYGGGGYGSLCYACFAVMVVFRTMF